MANSFAFVKRLVRSAEFTAIVLSITAVIMSAYSVLVVVRQHEDERTAELTHEIYSLVQEIWALKLDNPLLGHMFDLPDEYEATRDRLRLAVIDFPLPERIKLLESEKAMALMHFLVFEEMFYNYTLAVQSGNDKRAAISDEILDYFALGVLRNPRVLWLSLPEGGNLAGHLNTSSYDYYKAQVLENAEFPLTQEPDAEGLFPGVE